MKISKNFTPHLYALCEKIAEELGIDREAVESAAEEIDSYAYIVTQKAQDEYDAADEDDRAGWDWDNYCLEDVLEDAGKIGYRVHWEGSEKDGTSAFGEYYIEEEIKKYLAK